MTWALFLSDFFVAGVDRYWCRPLFVHPAKMKDMFVDQKMFEGPYDMNIDRLSTLKRGKVSQQKMRSGLFADLVFCRPQVLVKAPRMPLPRPSLLIARPWGVGLLACAGDLAFVLISFLQR